MRHAFPRRVSCTQYTSRIVSPSQLTEATNKLDDGSLCVPQGGEGHTERADGTILRSVSPAGSGVGKMQHSRGQAVSSSSMHWNPAMTHANEIYKVQMQGH